MSSGCCGGGKSAEKVQPASAAVKKATVSGKADAGARTQADKPSEAACHSPEATTGKDQRRGGCCE
jgi:hypothetical protein